MKYQKLSVIILALFVPVVSFACFDTFLFVRGDGGMVYPLGLLVWEGNGEYSVNRFDGSEPDALSAQMNLYYGFAPRLSFQLGLVSEEKERRVGWKADVVAIRAVWGVYRSLQHPLTWDLILEHHEGLEGGSSTWELSSPGIIRRENWKWVIHPVLSLSKGEKAGLRGHTGLFYLFSNTLVGIGAEYESAQSSSHLGQRLVRGEYGTSLFFGSALTPSLYLQNELIKGWGPGSSKGDVGFSFTLKVIVPTSRSTY